MATRLFRWWIRSLFQLKIWWLAVSGDRLERRIEERKRRLLRSL